MPAQARLSASSPEDSSTPLATDDEDLTEDPGVQTSSRLSGLRTLLVSLGRRSLDQAMGAGAESDSGMETRFQRASARPAYPDANAGEQNVPGEGAPSRLTAQPEFLPPRPVVELEAEKEKEAIRPASTRRDVPESDEIQTLPSWRGQYRKKRYPPI
jgi:hypothetical protein